MDAEDVYARTTRNRLEIANLLESLPPSQWQADTLCTGWTVKHMAAHLIQPMTVGFGRFFLASMRYRGNTAATVDHLTRELASLPRRGLIARLRWHAHDRINPPRVGPMGPFVETCIHLRDIARPLGLAATVRQDDWRVLLNYLTSPKVAPSLVSPETLSGLSLCAADADWSSGSGPEVSGEMEAIAMAVTGRPHALPDLDGRGVDILRGRIDRA